MDKGLLELLMQQQQFNQQRTMQQENLKSLKGLSPEEVQWLYKMYVKDKALKEKTASEHLLDILEDQYTDTGIDPRSAAEDQLIQTRQEALAAAYEKDNDGSDTGIVNSLMGRYLREGYNEKDARQMAAQEYSNTMKQGLKYYHDNFRINPYGR